jgi:hypothetical protein
MSNVPVRRSARRKMSLHVNGYSNVLPLLVLWTSGLSTTAFSIQPCSPTREHGHQCLRPTTFGMQRLGRADNPPQQNRGVSPLYIFAPPGSGYARPEDYPKSELPDTYEPMMAFPGTMRPGKTPENMPFQDLPIGDDDPDPVPWPHFQQIEWHHRWSEPPHPHPGTMEDFIESLGRWATPEQEAALRAGVRRDVRQRQEQAEAEKRDTIITDDDDDDDEQENDDIRDEPLSLGDGMFGKLGSDADRALTAAATVAPSSTAAATDLSGPDVADDPDLFTDDLDDFLLDLGLDAELEDDGGDILPILEEDEDPPIEALQQASVATSAFNVDDDIVSLGFDGDEDDELEGDGVSTVPLEDFGDGDSLDVEDIFDEGGFDYDDGDYGGGDDAW